MYRIVTRMNLLSAVGLAAAVGCASQGSQVAQSELERKLGEREERISSLESRLKERERALEAARAQTETPQVSAAPPTTPGADLLPQAKPGECYARVLIPARYETESLEVMERTASEKVEIIPAAYEWVEERALVKEASEKLELVPATYEWVEEQVLVAPASTELVEIPAEYGFEEERILVKPAHTVWKKGRGPIEKVDHATGEIMCLVDVPAEYETVKKRVLKSPARTEKREIPARYQTLKKQVQKTPPTTRKIEIPAEYKTVRVRKQVAPPQEKRVEIPAKYVTVTKRVKVSEDSMEWRPVLCQTNITADLVSSIQEALAAAGFSPGPVDGRIGSQTLSAVRSYQQAKGLPTGGLTVATLASLGVNIAR